MSLVAIGLKSGRGGLCVATCELLSVPEPGREARYGVRGLDLLEHPAYTPTSPDPGVLTALMRQVPQLACYTRSGSPLVVVQASGGGETAGAVVNYDKYLALTSALTALGVPRRDKRGSKYDPDNMTGSCERSMVYSSLKKTVLLVAGVDIAGASNVPNAARDQVLPFLQGGRCEAGPGVAQDFSAYTAETRRDLSDALWLALRQLADDADALRIKLKALKREAGSAGGGGGARQAKRQRGAQLPSPATPDKAPRQQAGTSTAAAAVAAAAAGSGRGGSRGGSGSGRGGGASSRGGGTRARGGGSRTVTQTVRRVVNLVDDDSSEPESDDVVVLETPVKLPGTRPPRSMRPAEAAAIAAMQREAAAQAAAAAAKAAAAQAAAAAPEAGPI